MAMKLLSYDFLILAVLLLVSPLRVTSTYCRCFPGDSCWPSKEEWAAFNATLNGKLIATTPLGSICHGTAFRETDCKALQSSWNFPETHLETSYSVMTPFWANQSCDPFTAKNKPCIIGTYVQYAVNTSSTVDILKSITFAKKRNIRLLVRNTGHDYFGKSTGAGALGIWMHHLKRFDVVEYESSAYTGKAVKIGAGVLSHEAITKSHENNIVVVGGNCPTVGIAGGYTQGGGFGPLTSQYGMAAHQVLEWEVVTVKGDLIKASPEENVDLYWALSGGGGGTYGIVLSMTVKAYRETRVAAANLTFTNTGVTQEHFYEAVDAFHSCIPGFSDSGGVAIWVLTSASFSLTPATGPGMTKQEMDEIFLPAINKLKMLNMSYTYTSVDFPNYFDSYKAMIPPSETGYFQIGGRILPRSALTTNADRLINAMRKINDLGAGIGGLSFRIPENLTDPDLNAVNPSLQNGMVSITVGTIWNNTDWNLNLANQDLMTRVLIPALDSVSSDSALTSYLNEADFQEPDWQNVFYGTNYQRLLDVKKKYDPEHILWGRTAVGSDAWREGLDGRLCQYT